MSIDFPNIDKKMAVFSVLSMDTTYDIGCFLGRVHAVLSMAYGYGRNMDSLSLSLTMPLTRGRKWGGLPTTPKKIIVQLLFFLAL